MGFALDGERGGTTIESRGVAHRIAFSVDPIRQEPRIARVYGDSPVKNGTRISVTWPNSASSILDDARPRFLQVAEDFAWINPHLSLVVKWDRNGGDPIQWTVPATESTWRKWRPSDPTSPHWYDEVRLARLIACNIAYAQDHGKPCRTVADFVRDFRGLSGTAKARDICEAAGAARMPLSEFYANGEGAARRVKKTLLSEMGQRSRPIRPRDLGVIGVAHLRAKFEGAGVALESFSYKHPFIAIFDSRRSPRL